MTELRIYGNQDVDLSKVIFTNLKKLAQGRARLLMNSQTYTQSSIKKLSTASVEIFTLLATPILRELTFFCNDPKDLYKINDLTKKCSKKFQLELEIERVCLKEFLE